MSTKPELPPGWGDLKKRVLGSTDPEAPTSAEVAAKAKLDKEAADKKKVADDAAAKKKADEDKAKADAEAKAKLAAGGGTTAPEGGDKPRVRKVKDGPALPEAKPNSKTVEEQVREALAETAKPGANGVPAVDPEVQREIDLAKFAETKHPDRYAGMAEKTATYYTMLREQLTAKAKELGGERSAEFQEWKEGDDYKALMAQRPGFQRGDRTKLAEDMIADRARAEARQEMEPEMKALARKTAELEHAPTIRAKTGQVYNIIVNDPRDEKDRDPALVEFAKDPLKFGAAHPEEAQLIAADAAEAIELAQEIYRIDLDLVEFNRAQPSPAHQKIRAFSRGLNEELRTKHPNGVETEDGKILVDADTYHGRKLDKDPRYRTFTADELAGALAATRASEVRAKLARRREGVAKSIYAPKGAPAQVVAGGQVAVATEEETVSPTAKSSSAPGAKSTPPKTAQAKLRDKYLNGK